MDLERGGGDSDGPRAPACRCRPPAPIEQTRQNLASGPTATARAPRPPFSSPSGPAPAFLLLVTATGQGASGAESVGASWW